MKNLLAISLLLIITLNIGCKKDDEVDPYENCVQVSLVNDTDQDIDVTIKISSSANHTNAGANYTTTVSANSTYVHNDLCDLSGSTTVFIDDDNDFHVPISVDLDANRQVTHNLSDDTLIGQ